MRAPYEEMYGHPDAARTQFPDVSTSLSITVKTNPTSTKLRDFSGGSRGGARRTRAQLILQWVKKEEMTERRKAV